MPEPSVQTPANTISPHLLRRASCATFAQQVLRGPAEAPYNGRFLLGDHHLDWNRRIHERNRLCVLAPRDHGKSFFWDFAYPIWKAEQIPNGKGYIFSGSQSQAVRILTDIKEEIEGNPQLAHLLPTTPDVWSSTEIKLRNGHRIYARGYGTKVRGAHPDWIVCDDVLNDEDAWSETQRRKRIEYFFTAISGMITPSGQLVVVGTPFHSLDLYGELAKNGEYLFSRHPALTAEGAPLWPARYDAKKLAAKKREIGSVRFTREFLCQPVSDDMSLFPSHLFRGPPTEQDHVVLGKPAAYWDELGVKRRFIGVDLAISASTGADYTVLFVLGLDDAGNRWVIDLVRVRGMAFRQQLSLIKAAARKYEPDMIFVEANQMQRVFGDELITTTDLPVKKFVTTGVGSNNRHRAPSGNTTSANRNALEGGVPALRVLLENGKFRIPRGDANSVAVTDEWIAEMSAFTWVDGKVQSVGAHDDMAMACWIADQAARQGGFSFSTGDEEGAAGVDEEGAADLDAFLAEQMAEPPPRPVDAADPLARLLARFGTGAPDEGDDPAPRSGTGSSGSLVDDDDLDEVDSGALAALYPARRR